MRETNTYGHTVLTSHKRNLIYGGSYLSDKSVDPERLFSSIVIYNNEYTKKIIRHTCEQ